VGVAFAVLLDSNPLKPKERQIVLKIVAEVLSRISENKAARCCRRESLIAIREAARLSREYLDLTLDAGTGKNTDCSQSKKNKECIKSNCPFWPGVAQILLVGI